jgi:hypothetical protein
MGRTIPDENFQNDLEAMLNMCLKLSDHRGLYLTAAHISTALDVLKLDCKLEVESDGDTTFRQDSSRDINRFTVDDLKPFPPGA